MARNRATFKPEEKLKVLLLARKILGPKGENWVQGAWRARNKKGVTSYDDAWGTHEATCWCLDGAVDEAAYRLGFRLSDRSNGVIGKATSLLGLAKKKQKILDDGTVFKFSSIVDFNDQQEDFGPVRKLLDERIKQLREEVKTGG